MQVLKKFRKLQKKRISMSRLWIFRNNIITMQHSFLADNNREIAIARLFLKNPPIIFLDGPTASLDAIATEQIKNSLDAIKEGRTVAENHTSLMPLLKLKNWTFLDLACYRFSMVVHQLNQRILYLNKVHNIKAGTKQGKEDFNIPMVKIHRIKASMTSCYDINQKYKSCSTTFPS